MLEMSTDWNPPDSTWRTSGEFSLPAAQRLLRIYTTLQLCMRWEGSVNREKSHPDPFGLIEISIDINGVWTLRLISSPDRGILSEKPLSSYCFQSDASEIQCMALQALGWVWTGGLFWSVPSEASWWIWRERMKGFYGFHTDSISVVFAGGSKRRWGRLECVLWR